MAKEKDLLIEFLEDYSVNAVYKALGVFEDLRSGISIVDIKGKKYFLKVRSESNGSNFYNVSINILRDDVEGSCNCPAMEKYGSCKHVALSALYVLVRAHSMSFESIEELLELNDEDDFEYIDEEDEDAGIEVDAGAGDIWSRVVEVANQAKLAAETTPAKIENSQNDTGWKYFNAKPNIVFQNVTLLFFGSPPSQIVRSTALISIDEKEVLLKFACQPHKTTIYHPEIKYDRHETFYYKCDCQDSNVKMCYHVKAAFENLAYVKDRSFFMRYKNWDIEKNALLKPFGLVITDKEAANIEFSVDYWGNLVMKHPSWLWKADFTDNLKGLKNLIRPESSNSLRPVLPPNTIMDFEVGFLFNLHSQHFKTGFELETVKVYLKSNKPSVKKLSLHQNATFGFLRGLPDSIYDLLLTLTDDGVKKYFSDKGNKGIYNYASPWHMLDVRELLSLKQHYITQLQKLWPHLCGREHVFILKEGTFNNNNIQPVKLSPSFLDFSFRVAEDQRYITLFLEKAIDGAVVPEGQGKLYHGFLFEYNELLYLPQNITDFDMLRQFEHGFVKIPASGRQQVIKSIIPLLQQKYCVEVPESLVATVITPEMEPQVLLKEMDNKFLVLHPQYKYQGFTVNYEENPDNIFLTPGGDDNCVVVVRNPDKEKVFFEQIRGLHPKFEKQTTHDFFFLPFEDTMKKNWFIDAIAGLVQNSIPVIGIQDLKKHKYNANKPVWEMKTGSGIDWFDLQIKVSFGDQVVSLRDVSKALRNQQNVVVLGDGTFGVLPEEWLKQYSMLLKMGDEQKDGTLRVSKMHYTIIDELHGQIDDEEILREINEKKLRLQNIGKIKSVKPAKEINATLRPYQLSGFQWFHMLDEMGWGGCLADDMGLGKTLQAITFLQYLKAKYKGSTHLVICPTSLIYNWESELKKFAPTLKYHIYYGQERAFSEEHFNDYDVVITSYGLIRNDLEDLMKFEWHYIILDESQAIKNPDGQTNKALQLLKSKNRMILSGTPIQNNTFDLFAQFNFINPGLLGNKEFFKTEFANPIDKNNDADKSVQLRRLIYPFMLRRTKEQVAPDLPDKTEIVLWCEMGKEQRKVYDDYKDYYRENLMAKIKEVGMAKAGMFVLEGLLRLRQICDSPVLVKDNEVTTRKSIKIDELLREIEENAGGHKLLVFSQFTEMLHLIEENLRAQKVDYVYLDGSTPAEKRREAVATFQEDPAIRVFLISLKAGGLGLNLTSADYVYIVDPWWNPAVEQQAIDRTHRIGQVNKIFAYKMICKDTVEEKIIQLQQRKKQLANELVTEDTGFIKKLTKDDVAFLFS